MIIILITLIELIFQIKNIIFFYTVIIHVTVLIFNKILKLKKRKLNLSIIIYIYISIYQNDGMTEIELSHSICVSLHKLFITWNCL